MNSAPHVPNDHDGHPASGDGSSKVVRIDRAEAASIALRVAINDRVGKASPRWMVDVAERMGVRTTPATGRS